MTAPGASRAPRSPWTGFGRAILRRPRAVAVSVLLLAALAGALAGTFLRVRPGYVDLLDERATLQRRYLDLIENFGNIETLYVLVDDTGSGGEADRFIERFSSLVRDARDGEGVPIAATVLDRLDPEWCLERLPAWLPEPILAGLARRDSAVDLGALLADPSPARILGILRDAIDRASLGAAPGGPGGMASSDVTGVAALLDGMADAARDPSTSVAGALLGTDSVVGAAGARVNAAGHVRAGPGRLLVTVTPADTSNDYRIMAPFLAAVKSAAAQALEETGGNARIVSYTGAPALIVDEMSAVSRDIAVASLLSVMLVTLLFFASFNSLHHVLFAGIANVAGLALTFGAAWILVGHLNLFSAVFAAVLAGLGIDFGIHVINHYEARRRDGLGATEALLGVFESVVPAIVTSAVTTAAAFLAIMTSEFDGFSQLGLISGVGVVLCVAMSITLIPALLIWDARRRPERPAPRPAPPWSRGLLVLIPRHARSIAAIGLVATLVALAGLARLRFDHDLMNLQPAGTEAVELQRKEERRVSTHQAFSLVASPAEAGKRAARFAALPSVAAATSLASLLPPDSPTRQQVLGALAARVAELPPTERVGGSIDAAATLAACDELLPLVQELQDLAFDAADEDAVAALDSLLAPLRRLREAVANEPSAIAGLSAFRDDLARALRGMIARLPELAQRPLGPRDLPAALAERFVGRDGRLAVIVEPRESVWDRAALERFVSEIRTVDPDATGPPVQLFEITELMRRSLERAALVALLVIVVLTLVSMRGPYGTILALLPLLVGFVLMLGAMAWMGVALNPANLVALPLLLGIGVDGGVHVAHRWLAIRDATRTVEEVGHPLLITSLTTVAGFLPLLLARHRGIRSLGVVTCVGSVTMLVAAVVLMPAVLALLDRRRHRGSLEA